MIQNFVKYKVEGKSSGLSKRHYIDELSRRVSNIPPGTNSVAVMLRRRTKSMHKWTQQDRQEHNRRRVEPAGPEAIEDARLRTAPWRDGSSRV